MGMGGRSDGNGLKMLVVYGSQTGSCRMIITKMAEHWKSKGVVGSVDVQDGNTLTHETEELSQLVAQYDVMVVCTSSFGDGDPPDNYGQFLLKLLTSSEEDSSCLKGMQHAVLGEGSSVYSETFQNCPRLTDKYLEACGSRRFVARHETDVGGEEEESINRGKFRDAVAAALQNGKLPDASSPPAAEWGKPRAAHGEPTTKITLKSVADLSGRRGQSLGQILVPATVALVAISAFVYSQFVMEASA